MAITTKHFFARNGMFSQSGSHMMMVGEQHSFVVAAINQYIINTGHI